MGNNINNYSSKENNSITITVFISIFLLLIFIFSYIYQSDTDLRSFDNCISNNSCLYKLISITNSTNLCEHSSNKSMCYLSFSIKLEYPNLCFNTNEPLVCILTLSLQNNNNFCEEYKNAKSKSYLNQTNEEIEELIRTCNRNVEFYRNNSLN